MSDDTAVAGSSADPVAGAVPGTRRRVLEAALTCVELRGLAKTTLEDVAAAAALSRATVYRYFPGGRDELITTTVMWEVGNFLQRLGQAVADDHGLEVKLVHALQVGHREIEGHKLLQQVLSTEPEALLKELAASGPVLGNVLRDSLIDDLRREPLRPGVDIDEAADYLARHFLSYVGSQGRWDLDDRGEVERLVRMQFLAGIVEVPVE